jgi:hypothetical protein
MPAERIKMRYAREIFRLKFSGVATRECAVETYARRGNDLKIAYGSCLKDDGRPIGIGFQKQVSNHPKLP